MWCIRNSNPCRQAEFTRSLYFQIISGGTWFLAFTVEADSIDSAKSHWLYTRYERSMWEMWAGAVRLAHWWVLMINQFSRMWISGGEEMQSTSVHPCCRTHIAKPCCGSSWAEGQCHLWSEQFDYIHCVQEESWEFFNCKSWIALYYLFLFFYCIVPYLTLQHIFILKASACLFCAWKLWCLLNTPI